MIIKQIEIGIPMHKRNLLGTTEVTWKPILTTIPDVRFEAYKANTAYDFTYEIASVIKYIT